MGLMKAVIDMDEFEAELMAEVERINREKAGA